ncbi:hypothetical protein MT355_20985 [Rathayibacter sp. VKM Ac-2929]|uniref:hypothetical protein n=1 Tax=Rathayibacter sp. VKM Ac-2929 TaxID=2929480 RepID=UPI001FB29F58|nr:hypothetical protein [Rathayibacter sp. VKM Ac-2929]MCJ1675751.1 hypothetical protein [Rathayibacter sp. VKM Ac-2929]
MAKADSVAPSRAGDKFHYYWAARKALELLRPNTSLTEIVVEGRSPSDRETDADEVIDVAEYHGEAGARSYIQLKHSIRRLHTEWRLSDFADVIARFAKICADLLEHGAVPIAELTFRIVTNRPISSAVFETVAAVVAGGPETQSTRALRRYIVPLGDHALDFLGRLEFDDREPGVQEQVDLLSAQGRSYLVSQSSDLMLRLKEVVANRAASEAHEPIRRSDVLVALKIDEDDLLPRPSDFPADDLIDRPVYRDLRERIAAERGPFVVHAPGGVGKSSFTAWLNASGGEGDEVVAFDCFAGGSYRLESQLRHDHRRGLTQIANELATRNLCGPLIPVDTADPTQYMRAFLTRLEEAAALVASRSRRLIIVIDAADNAVMAAQSQIGSPAFPPGLLRETMPDNVRLVLTARSERLDLLNLPPNVRKLPLEPLSETESGQMLERKFGVVTSAQATEFRDATWGNPRVQTFAIGAGDSIAAVLGRLSGLRLSSASEALNELIRDALAKVRDSYGSQAADIDLVCAVLASLRPVIRLATVAELAQVPVSLLESFLIELPFSVQRVGDTLHFRDEPTETYFRTHLMPAGATLDMIIERVEQNAPDSFYLASALPQLLWESGRHQRLIELALADSALPTASSTEARDVAKNRTNYSLRASIELRQWGSAARLALRAGRLSEASTVRDRVIAQNCDLAGFALDLELADRYVASRSLGLGEPGFNLAREGLLLAARPESHGAALGRLRSAYDWMRSYSALVQQEGDAPGIGVPDIADILLGRLSLEGPDALEKELGKFREWVHFPAMLIVAQRHLDRAGIATLERFLATTRHRYAALACCQAIWSQDLALGAASSRRISQILARSRAAFEITDRDDSTAALTAVLAAVALTVNQNALTHTTAHSVLTRHLPASPPTYLGDSYHWDRSAYAFASALVAALEGSALDAESLASDNVLKHLGSESSSDQETRQFRRNVVPTLPWLNAWARSTIGADVPDSELTQLRASLPKGVSDYDPPRLYARWVTRAMTSLSAHGLLPAGRLARWMTTHSTILGDAILIRSARALQHQTRKRRAVADQIIRFIDTRARSQVEGASARTALYIDLARACWSRDPERARAYFFEALDAADLLGDEVHLQWMATTKIAALTVGAQPDDTRALGVARAGEAIHRADLLEIYSGDTIRTIAGISPVAAIDIASRWRDRGTSTLDSSLDGMLRHDDDKLRHVPDLALAIASLHHAPVGALAERSAASHPEQILGHALAIVDRRGGRPEHDAALCRYSTEHGRPLTYQEPDPGHSYTNPQWFEPRRDEDHKRKRRQARAELSALTFDTPAGWADAFALATRQNDLNRDDVFLIALTREGSGDLSTRIRALPAALPDLYLAESALKFLAALKDISSPERRAIQETVEGIINRFSFDEVTSSYRSFPLELVSHILGRTVTAVTEATFANWARSSEPTTVEGFYALSVHLAELSDPAGKLALLDDAIEQFAPVVDAVAANLPAVSLPTDPGDLNLAVARLVWAALADPSTSIRWDAAFAVLGLLRMSQSDCLSRLADLALQGGPGQAADPAFEFYGLHAEWFLLIALRRAVINPELHEGVRVFAPFVTRVLAAPPHAVLTPLAEQLAEALGLGETGPWPRLAPVQVGWSHRGRDYQKRPKVGYKFGWDFREQQIHNVADAFGVVREQLEREVSDVITRTWGRAERGSAAEDARHSAGLFERMETSDRYESPPVHDLDHYLSLHALMTVAGRLAVTERPHQSEGSDEDEFTYWLRKFRTVRTDGYWVAETRVSAPDRTLDESGDDNLWRWGVGSADFAPYLHLSDESFACWADHDVEGITRSESVRVQTVLVPRDLASAYCRALQLDRDLWDFRIPIAHDDDEDDGERRRPDPGPFIVQPWVRIEDGRTGLDKFDAAVGNLRFPPPLLDAPVARVVEDDTPPRIVWRATGGAAVAWAEAWDDHGYRHRGRSGSCLTMTYQHLDQVLGQTAHALVAVVSIDRRLRGHLREEFNEGGVHRYDHSYRVFEYRPRTGWLDFRGRPQTGKGPGR